MKKRFFLYFIPMVVILLMTGCAQKKQNFHKTKYTTPAWHKATMKSYSVMGKRYHPTTVSIGQVQHGISSWYGPDFHGKYTSNGEVYNMHARTAAHKTWPMDTIVKVTNLQNGKSTVVRINDRGPFVRGRIIDCSYTAGKEIGLDKMGIAKVKVEVLGFAGKINLAKNIPKQKKAQKPTPVTVSGLGVQVGAFSHYKGAKNHKLLYAKKYPNYKAIIKRVNDEEGIILYRVWLMGFGSQQEAQEFKENNYLFGASIVRS